MTFSTSDDGDAEDDPFGKSGLSVTEVDRKVSAGACSDGDGVFTGPE